MKNNQFKVRDEETSHISRLENQLRFNTEQQQFNMQEVALKVKNLEDQVLLSDKIRTELRDKLRVTEDGNREMISFIKNLQQQGD